MLSDMLGIRCYTRTSISYVTSGINYESYSYIIHTFYVRLAYALYKFRERLSFSLQYASVLDIFFVCPHTLAETL